MFSRDIYSMGSQIIAITAPNPSSFIAKARSQTVSTSSSAWGRGKPSDRLQPPLCLSHMVVLHDTGEETKSLSQYSHAIPGIAVGHAYYFLEDVFPNKHGGTRLLKTPAFM